MYGRGFWIGLLIGWAVIGFGVKGAVDRAGATRPLALALWLAGSAVVHDLVVVPITLAVGFVVLRVVPRRLRAPVQGALVVSGILVLFSLPLILGLGGVPGNPSLRPRDYATGLGASIVAVWALCVLLLVRARRRPERSPETTVAARERAAPATAGADPAEPAAPGDQRAGSGSDG